MERIASSDGEEELKAIRSAQKNHAEVICGWKWAAQYDDTYNSRERMPGLFRYLELTNQPEEGKALFDWLTCFIQDMGTGQLSWVEVGE